MTVGDVRAPDATTSPDAAPPSTAEVDPSGQAGQAGPSGQGATRPRRFGRARLGIQSRLMLMLLLTSVVSCLVVGLVAYQSGRSALRDSAFARLTEVRESRSREITRQYSQLRDSLVIYTRGSTAIEAVNAFEAGFDELDAADLCRLNAGRPSTATTRTSSSRR